MGKLYFAAPKRFETVDFSKIGTGQKVARNGHGIYMGEKHLALHYLDTYSHYGEADNTYISKNGNIIDKNSVAGKKIGELELEYAEEGKLLEPYVIGKIIESEFEIKLMDSYKGCIYEADTSSLNTCDESHDLATEEYYEIIDAFYDKTEAGKRAIEKIHSIKSFFKFDEALDIEVYFNSTTPSELISELVTGIYNALEEAHDQDFIDIDFYHEFDDECVKSFIYKTLAGDDYSFNSYDKDIESLLESELVDKIKSLRCDGFTLEMEGASIKSTYSLLCKSAEEMGLDISLMGEIIKEVTSYDSYQCENNMAQNKSFEYVVFSKSSAEAIKIKEVNRDSIEPGLEQGNDYNY